MSDMSELRKDLTVMDLLYHVYVVLPLFISFLQTTQGEVVHITVMTARHTDLVYLGTGFQPRYQCYRSAPDKDASLTFGRAAYITSSIPPPPARPHNTLPNVMSVRFPDARQGENWGTNGYGPFYCEARKPGRDVTRVITFFQRGDAKFRPDDGLFTRTVNVNDTEVVITMEVLHGPNTAGNVYNWRKDGGSGIASYDGLSRITLPSPIQTSDAGIYEINYGYERNQGRGGLYRLIVRECPAGKWGPPGCHDVCNKCYNGGVCDDKSGLCICPNNFKGPNCLDICRPDGGNRFGLNCEFRCTNNPRDNPTACHEYLYCLPDPYGCSCDVGARGWSCNLPCSAGFYGPGCSQRCHCASGSCDKYTGGCDSGCQTGWSGENCQIPDVCDAGYYGPQCINKCHCLNDAPCNKETGECPQQECAPWFKVRRGQVHCQECVGGSYGPDCLPLCHCAADACETKTGRCNGQCLHNWIEPNCTTGISELVSLKVNPYEPSVFTCYVEGDPFPDESSVLLYAGNTYNNTGISRRSSSVSGSQLAVVFDVERVLPEPYVCNVSINGTASFLITNTTYVLPVIDGEPLVLNDGSSKVRLRWNAWSEEDDIGDPPLAGYDIFMKADSDWMKSQRVNKFTTSATVGDLNPDTDYMFSVAAVRVGQGGTGPRSPGVNARTPCEKPSASPTEVQTTANNPKELEITWQPIGNGSAECRSGVTHYVIYFITIGSTSARSVNVYNATTYTIIGLDTYTDYTIQMTAANKDEESDRSIATVSRTLEEVPPAPLDVNVLRSTTNSFTLSWSIPPLSNLNGNIKEYRIRYQKIDDVAGDYAVDDVPVGVFEKEHTVTGLTAETNYTVQVQTVNGAGSGKWSRAVNVQTISNWGLPIPLHAFVASLVVFILLLILGLVLFIRIRGKRRFKNGRRRLSLPRNPDTNKSSPSVEHKYFDGYQDPTGTDFHTYQDLHDHAYAQIPGSYPGNIHELTRVEAVRPEEYVNRDVVKATEICLQKVLP